MAQPSASQVYLTKTYEIREQLARLQELADNHFNHDAEQNIHWGHVGDLTSVQDSLNEILSRFGA